jgi:environmental stress-induced protein Ves
VAVEFLRAADRRAVAWKNGGGVTSEVAVEPSGSDLAGFDWRVSIARVESAGPFSVFPGIERRLAVLEGELELTIAGADLQILTRDSQPLTFSGETAVYARPRGAPVTDLNVMTRVGRCSAHFERRRAHPGTLCTEAPALLVALSRLAVLADGQRAELARLDALRVSPGAALSIATLEPQGEYCWIEILIPGGNLAQG